MATHKQDTPSAMASPPTIPSNKSTAALKQETPVAMASPPTSSPPESTATHKQGTTGAIAPMSATPATDHRRIRNEEAQSASTLDTNIARADSQAMASHAVLGDSASSATATTALPDLPAPQHEPALAGDGGELEDGEVFESEEEVCFDGSRSNEHRDNMINTVDTSDKCFQAAILREYHNRVEQLESNHNAATQSPTNSHASSESEPFVSLPDLNKRHRSTRTLRARYIALVPQLELLGNRDLEGKRGTVFCDGAWYIKKLRPVVILALIGDNQIVGIRVTTFSGTHPNALPRKQTKSDSFGEDRLLLRDYVQMIADHHSSGTFVPKVPQCYNDGEIQLHWDGLESLNLPDKQFCFVSLLETSTFALGTHGIILVGALSEDSWNKYLTMQEARLSTFFREPQGSLKRKRETSDDSVSCDIERQTSIQANAKQEPSRPPPSSTFNRPSTRREESNDSTKTSVPFVPAQVLNQMSQDMRRRYQAAFGRAPVAAVQDPVGFYTSLANNMARMGHSSQNATLRPGMPTQATRHSHPEAAQNSGNVGTNTEESMCTHCHKPNHTDAQCWILDPSKKPQKTRNRRATQASIARPPAGPINHNNHNNRNNQNVNSITNNIHHGDGNIAGSHEPNSARHQRQPRSLLDTRSRDYHRRDRRDRRAESPEDESRRGRRYEPREDFHRGSRSRAFPQSHDYPGRDYPDHDYRGSYNHY